MRMNPDNFLYAIKQLVVGSSRKNADGSSAADGGFNQDYNLGLNGATLGSTTIMAVDGSGVPILSNPVSSTNGSTNTFGTWSFLVPRDYDENTDKLIVRATADSNGATDTPVLTIASSTMALTSTGSTYAGIVNGLSSTFGAMTNTPTIYEADFSGLKLVRDTIVTIKIGTPIDATGRHNTDKINLYNAEVVYASSLVAFNDEVITGGKAVGYDVLGNPLR